MNINSNDFTLGLEAQMVEVDKVVQHVIANADAGAPRTASVANLDLVVTNAQVLETEVLKFVDELAAYTPALPTYTAGTTKLYRGSVEVGANAAAKTAILVEMAGVLTAVLAWFDERELKEVVSNRGKSVATTGDTTDTDNTLLTKSGAYNTAYDDIQADLATEIAAVPVLATS